MMAKFLCSVVLVVNCHGEDSQSLLQSRSSIQRLDVGVISQFSEQVQRMTGVQSVFQETMICSMVSEGVRAPTAGTFTSADGSFRVVKAGEMASTGGKYCVDANTFSLLQRSHGVHSVHDVEEVVARKENGGGEETENSTGGKGGEDAETTGAPTENTTGGKGGGPTETIGVPTETTTASMTTTTMSSTTTTIACSGVMCEGACVCIKNNCPKVEECHADAHCFAGLQALMKCSCGDADCTAAVSTSNSNAMLGEIIDCLHAKVMEGNC